MLRPTLERFDELFQFFIGVNLEQTFSQSKLLLELPRFQPSVSQPKIEASFFCQHSKHALVLELTHIQEALKVVEECTHTGALAHSIEATHSTLLHTDLECDFSTEPHFLQAIPAEFAQARRGLRDRLVYR